MSYKSDIEIARGASKALIQDIGAKIGIGTEDLLPYGHEKAKVSQSFINSVQKRENGKLIWLLRLTLPLLVKVRLQLLLGLVMV